MFSSLMVTLRCIEVPLEAVQVSEVAGGQGSLWTMCQILSLDLQLSKDCTGVLKAVMNVLIDEFADRCLLGVVHISRGIAETFIIRAQCRLVDKPWLLMLNVSPIISYTSVNKTTMTWISTFPVCKCLLHTATWLLQFKWPQF